MKERVFIKKNVFTCVMFGAIFLFITYESFISDTDLSILAFFIAIPTFILSLLKLMVDIFENINDKITNFLKQTEENKNIEWKVLDDIRKNDDNNVIEIIKEYLNSHQGYEWIEENLEQYHKARGVRKKVRKMRRAILYFYYSIFMFMFLLLLLHTELTITISNGLLGEINLDLFTLWSLIVVLIEIMMKDIFEEIVIFFLNKKIGTNLDWY
ncbi:MAG: hypothetical protein HDT39_14300 [Lachnospiraceae bacterium]|nr:hypothetical protein [Lachnospiraceae bacterium]